MNYDILIVGGGPSGLSCAIMLASAKEFYPELKELRVAIIDEGASDAHRAQFFNAPGVPVGISGTDLLNQTKEQLKRYDSTFEIFGKVTKISKDQEKFEVDYYDKSLNEKSILKCNKIVLATGFRSFGIKGLNIKIKHFEKSTNPTRVQVENDKYKVEENIYACGLFSGDSSQWPIVTGSGAQVGINIISEYMGEWKVMHDK